MLGTELGSSTRTVCALGLWAIAVAPIPQILPSADTRGMMQLHGDPPHLAAVVICHVYLLHTVLQVKEDHGNLRFISPFVFTCPDSCLENSQMYMLLAPSTKKKKNLFSSEISSETHLFKCWASWQNWLPEESLSLVMCWINPWREGFPLEYLLKGKILKSWRHILFSL